MKLILALAIMMSASRLVAAIFGDGQEANGIEDSRVGLMSAPEYAQFAFVGQILCKKFVRGSGVLLSVNSLDGHAVPVVLTAAHILSESLSVPAGNDDRAMVDCGYVSRARPWDVFSLSSERVSGTAENHARSHRFLSDWVVTLVEPWPNWQHYALTLNLDGLSGLDDLHSAVSHPAMLVGYDVPTNGLMVDPHCRFGSLSDSAVFRGGTKLVWDDCDSEQGSSGGALVRVVEDETHLLGIRVGNLFDTDLYPDGPNPGDPFDINKNINVVRLLDDEVRGAIQMLLSR